MYVQLLLLLLLTTSCMNLSFVVIRLSEHFKTATKRGNNYEMRVELFAIVLTKVYNCYLSATVLTISAFATNTFITYLIPTIFFSLRWPLLLFSFYDGEQTVSKTVTVMLDYCVNHGKRSSWTRNVVVCMYLLVQFETSSVVKS